MPDDSLLADLLLQWEDRRDQGENPSPEDLCRDHPELLDGLRQKIAVLEAMNPVLSARSPTVFETLRPQSASDQPTAPRLAALPPAFPEVAGYLILGELGRGGMGVVYKAKHLILKRTVALKMIRAAANPGPEEIARFRLEAEAIARLKHPNIVQIHDVGQHKDSPYFAIEYVAGGNLARRLNGKPIAFRQAAELTETLARAVHYAHEQGIVHRDLKPGNILLEKGEDGNNEAIGAPKITDFGLAKFFAETDSAQTASGSILGTPSYMAPEQARGRVREIGPAADVYALGAILYEMLTGRPPFLADSAWDTIAQVTTQEPVPPSRLQPKVPRDLETICLRCLDKTPSRRFASAQELADDVRRFLDGRPILARPVGVAERVAKWARRRPAIAAMSAVIALAAISLLTLGIRYSLDLKSANDTISKEWDKTKAAEKTASEQYEQSRRSLYDLQLAFVKMVHDKDPGRGLTLLGDETRCPADLRDFTWGLFRNVCKRDRVAVTHAKEARSVAFLNDGKDGVRLASADADGSITIWDGKREVVIPEATGDRLAVSPRGDWLAAAGANKGIRLMKIGPDGQAGETVQWTDNQAAPVALAISADGGTLASAHHDGSVLVRRLPKGEPRKIASVGTVAALALTADGRTLAVATDAGLRVWDLSADKEIAGPTGLSAQLTALAFTLDGARLVACDHEGVVRWWATDKWAALGRFEVPRTILWTISLSPDSRSFAVAGMDGVVRVVDLAGGDTSEQIVFTGHTGPVWSVAFSPDGRTLASAGQDRTVRVWDLKPRIETAVLVRKSAILSAAFSADSQILATGGKDGFITLWERDTGKRLKTFSSGQGPVTALAFAPTSPRLLASAGGDGSIKTWSSNALDSTVPPAATIHLKGHAKAVLSIAFSPDGATLGSCGQDGTVRLWDPQSATGRCQKSFDEVLWSIAFSPDGRAFAVGGSGGVVHLCDASANLLADLANIPARKGGLFAVAFSPDGKTLAAGGTDHAIELWDWPLRTPGAVLTGHRQSVGAVAFPPDGRTLASIANDGHVRLWDLVTGQERIRLETQTEGGNGVLFSPDGRTLAAFGDFRVVMWDSGNK